VKRRGANGDNVARKHEQARRRKEKYLERKDNYGKGGWLNFSVDIGIDALKELANQFPDMRAAADSLDKKETGRALTALIAALAEGPEGLERHKKEYGSDASQVCEAEQAYQRACTRKLVEALRRGHPARETPNVRYSAEALPAKIDSKERRSERVA
jgi:hypothetical protein